MAIDWVAYVSGAIDRLEADYFWTTEVDWDGSRAGALESVSSNPTRTGAHNAIRGVLSGLRGGHLRLVVPGFANSGVPGSPPPTGTRIGGFGYLLVPALPGFNEQYRTYAAQLQDLMRVVAGGDPPCGWVIDLRGNTGGIMMPMLLGVGPLLGDGVFLSYQGPHDHVEWAYADGHLLFNGDRFDDEMLDEVMRASGFGGLPEASRGALQVKNPITLPSTGSPVAVLFGGSGTASAGEGVLVSFLGRPDTRSFGDSWSAGFTDFGEGVVLPDGALLLIPTAVAHDRMDNSYPDPILPDELVLDPATDDRDPVLEAALEWLGTTTGCPTDPQG